MFGCAGSFLLWVGFLWLQQAGLLFVAVQGLLVAVASPSMAGRFLPTAPPGKSSHVVPVPPFSFIASFCVEQVF